MIAQRTTATSNTTFVASPASSTRWMQTLLLGGLAVCSMLPEARAQATVCGNLVTGEFDGTFGTLAANTYRDLQVPPPLTSGYTYQGNFSTSPLLGGRYVVVSQAGADAIHTGASHWQNLYGHNAGGGLSSTDAYLAVNGSTAQGMFFSQTVVLVAGESYRLSLWGINATDYSSALPDLRIRVLDSTGTEVASTTTGPLPARTSINDSTWRQATIDFSSGAGGTFTLQVLNISRDSGGNDFALDDVSITPLTNGGCPSDFGDAPDTTSGTGPGDYQTLAAYSGPQHALVAGLFLGSGATADINGQPNATATGDVDDAFASTPGPYLAIPGTTYSVTIPIQNTTGNTATVAGFLDFNGDGDFLDAGESATTTAVTNATSATLSFTVPSGAVVGDVVLRLRIALQASQIATALGRANSGEVEDYMVTLRPGLTLRKTWVRALVNHTATVNATGLTALSSVANTTDETDASAPQTVAVGSTVNISETFGGGATQANYVSQLACTGANDTTPADGIVIASTDRNIVCTYTNTRRVADVSITKTNTSGTNNELDQASDTLASGATTTYTIVVSNNGPSAADGTLLTDPAVPGLNCTAAQCTTTTGGAVCPGGSAPPQSLSLTGLQQGGLTIPTLPSGSSVTVTLTCMVP